MSNIKTRKGFTVHPVPTEAGKIVGIINFKNRIILATEYRVYECTEVNDAMSFTPIGFKREE